MDVYEYAVVLELQVVQHGLKGGYTWIEDGSDLES